MMRLEAVGLSYATAGAGSGPEALHDAPDRRGGGSAFSTGRAAATASDAIATTLYRHDAGLRDPGMERVVFPNLAIADRVLAACIKSMRHKVTRPCSLC